MSFIRNNLKKGSGKKVLFHKIAGAFLYYAKLSFTAEYTAEKDCTVLFSVLKGGRGRVPDWACTIKVNDTTITNSSHASVENWLHEASSSSYMTTNNGNYNRRTAFSIKAGDTVKITASAPLSTDYGMPGIVVNVDIIG